MERFTQTNSRASIACVMLAIAIVLISILSFSVSEGANADVVFAEVGDSAEIYAYVEPTDANQEVTWELAWDPVNTSEGEYNRIKDYPPTNNVGMLVEGNKCTIWCVKYHTVVWVKQTVYLTLTAKSVEDESICATCLIKLG